MNEPIVCPVCEDPGHKILEARCAGSIIRLSPRQPAPQGLWAVRQDGETLKARRLLSSSSALFEGERKYSAHNCAGRGGGLAEVRQAQSQHAHAARTRRGRWRPKDNPFGRASGVRVLPPSGGDAA